MDPRERFSATVEDYRRYRPDYPEALFDWMMDDAQLAPGDVVVDVGCGTGISSRQLAARGLEVVGVDPNEDMLAVARETPGPAGSSIRYVRGDGETLPIETAAIEPGEVAAVVGGQSFHWLDLDRALPRFAEVLRPGPSPEAGRVIAFWNLREPGDALMAQYEALLRAWCPEYENVGAEPRAEAVAAHPRVHDLRRVELPHAQALDRAGFHGRVWSSSYVRSAVADGLDGAAFDAALDALFDAHAEKGRARFVYRTVALSFRPG